MSRQTRAMRIKSKAKPLFITRAERALKRAAHNVNAETRRAGLLALVWTRIKAKVGKS